MPDPQIERFVYAQYARRSLGVAKLDALFESALLKSGAGTVGAIIGGIKLLVILGYLIARKKMLDEDLQLARAGYEQRSDNRDDIDQDGLSSSPRNGVHSEEKGT